MWTDADEIRELRREIRRLREELARARGFTSLENKLGSFRHTNTQTARSP